MPYADPQRAREYQRSRYWANVDSSRADGRRKWHRRGEAATGKRWNPTPRVSARNQLRTAVRLGHIVKPDHCGRCGEKTEKRRLHGHHADYSKPLEVDWLCSRCHGEEGRK